MWQAGLATGLICLACPQLTQSSIVIMSDVPALCFAAGCVYAAIRYRDSERTEWLTLSGVLLSVALMCRWQYALSVIPIAIWVFPKRGVTVKLIRTVLIAGGVAGCVYLPQALMTIRDGERYRTSQITWNIENIGRNQFTTADGVIQYTLPNFAYYTLPLSSPYYLSPLLIPFALIGIGWLWRRDRRTAVGWIVWGVSHYLFLSGLPVQNIRYALSVFLPVAILVGIGVGVSLGYAQQRSPANSRASTFR
jgi:4-amino-4-deoxy-L-arabinose transferase-like glycosyltransferase